MSVVNCFSIRGNSYIGTEMTNSHEVAVENAQFEISVKTGDVRGAGTDCKLFIILHDDRDMSTGVVWLGHRFTTNCRGQLSKFYINTKLQNPKEIKVLEFYLEKFGVGELWYCEYFEIKILDESLDNPVMIFPARRWISATEEHYILPKYDSALPQCAHARTLSFRNKELIAMRSEYKYDQRIENGPVQVRKLPSDEQFSDSYSWTFAQEKAKLLGQTKIIEWSTNKWGSFKKFIDVFSNFKKSLGEPRCMDMWSEDKWFGLQRVSGTNCMVIRLCKQIPDNLDVTNDTVSKLLEGFTLEEALEKNKIFLCDLSIMEGINCKDDRVLAVPLALFYLNKKDTLLPIAIQLMQQKAKDNPVFTPLDEPSTWLVAKMYYNNAEAQHHQGVTHLGRTHLLMEGICVCTHRNLSPSHPLFKLLAPHFLFLLATNARGLEKLVSIGGWVDCCMTQGVVGIFELISRGVASYRADIDGVPEREMEERGVLDPEILPYYPYRDDAIPLYAAIQKYVSKVLNHHYDSPSKIKDDHELQMWRKEMTASIIDGGAGIGGVPGNETEGFTELSEVISITTTIIATCSMGHAAANFQQYDQYAFVPNYPGILMSPPPTTKREYSQEDLMALLPNKRMTLDIMVISKLISNKGTNSLGYFEVQYQYDPVGVEAAKQLRKDLAKVSFDIKKRNVDREVKYDCMDPAFLPNSISV